MTAISRKKKKGTKKNQYAKLVRSYVVVTTCYLMMIMSASVHVADEIVKIEERKEKYIKIANQRFGAMDRRPPTNSHDEMDVT